MWRMLVVDDEAAIGRAVARCLRPAWDVTVVASAEEAWPLVRAHRFDVLLLDSKPPGMSGRQFYEQLLRLEPAVAARVIFMTGYPDLVVDRPLLLKPFKIDALRTSASRIVQESVERERWRAGRRLATAG